ncbi:MAG: hypothetical protein RIE86_01795 [Imperialibacter sp.]|uniref:hypothetical protein n=1 Tax=Imperialibacter sp. TaxID=2038411 RepID=UPI0032ED3E56
MSKSRSATPYIATLLSFVLFVFFTFYFVSCNLSERKVDFTKWKGEYVYDEFSILRITDVPNDEFGLDIMHGAIDDGTSITTADISVSELNEVLIDGQKVILQDEAIVSATKTTEHPALRFPKLSATELDSFLQNRKPRPFRVNKDHDVFVAGVEDCKAKYWVNGEAIIIHEGAEAKLIAATQNDIYIVLADCNSNRVEWYWKSGKTFQVDGDIYGMFVDGEDLYLVGQSRDGKPVLWKNGTQTYLMSSRGVATSIFVQNGRPYITIEDLALNPTKTGYWFNGSIYSLPRCKSPKAIFVAENIVYVTGEGWDWDKESVVTIKKNVSKYWVNGNEYLLSDGTTKYATRANSIFVNNSDVYIAGVFDGAACYWKNGVLNRLTDGNYAAYSNSIYIDNADVFVVGYESGYGDEGGAKLWKNGEKTQLSSSIHSNAFGIYIK